MVVLRKKACPREVIAVPSHYPSPTGRVSFEWRLGFDRYWGGTACCILRCSY